MSGAKVKSKGVLATTKNTLPRISSTLTSSSGQPDICEGKSTAFPIDTEQNRVMKPKAYVCYLCGQVHGSAHYLSHIPQCELRFTQAEALKPIEQRRVLPHVPPEVESGSLPLQHKDIEAFNQRMGAIFDKLNSITCPVCANTFGPEAFKKHSKICTPDTPMGVPKIKAKPPRTPAGGVKLNAPIGRDLPFGTMTNLDNFLNAAQPISYTCYLCGMQYGSASLHIHIPQCIKKWLETESRQPRDVQRPLPPPPPEVLSGILPKDPAEVDEFNSRMWELWESRALFKCPICDRSFKEDAWKSHQKVCTIFKPGGPLGLKKAPTMKAPVAPNPDDEAASEAGKLPVIPGAATGKAAKRSGTRRGSYAVDTAMPPIALPRPKSVPSSPDSGQTDSKPKAALGLEILPPVLPSERESVSEGGSMAQSEGGQSTPSGRTSFIPIESLPPVAMVEVREPESSSSGAAYLADPLPDLRYRCFLCGEMHSSSRLFVHIAMDLQRWQMREGGKPRELRLPAPPIPEELTAQLPIESEALAAFNNKMAEVNLTLVTCPGCMQSFSPMAYEEHYEACPKVLQTRQAAMPADDSQTDLRGRWRQAYASMRPPEDDAGSFVPEVPREISGASYGGAQSTGGSVWVQEALRGMDRKRTKLQALDERIEYRPASEKAHGSVNNQQLQDVLASMQAKLDSLQAKLDQKQQEANKPIKSAWFNLSSLFGH